MSNFNLGSSTAFGNSKNVASGNVGTNFWGHKYFKFDGSLKDKENLLKAVQNFGKILTGKIIPVRYSTEGDKSYTDGKTITISSEIIPSSLDSTIGLFLHEATHTIKTDFNIIKKLMDKTLLPNKYDNYVNFIKNLHNWVEDRRIDNWTFNKAPGYKVYYHELYKRYFYGNEMLDEALKTKQAELKKETGRNYQFFIINSLNHGVKMNELKGLPEIEKIIDIDTINRLKDTNDTMETAINIFDVILKNISDEEKEKINNDNYSAGVVPIDIDELIRKLLEMQEGFLDHNPIDANGNSIKITLNEEQAKLLDALIKSNTEIENVKHHVNNGGSDGEWSVLTVNHLDEHTIKSGLYDIFYPTPNLMQQRLIENGFALGKMLGRKLKVRNDEKVVRMVNQRSGKIDKRALYKAGFGADDIFFVKKESKYNDLSVHISVDMSGSMGGDKWHNTLVSVVGIAKGCSMIKGIRVQISLRYSDEVTSSMEEAVVINFYDSKYDDIVKLNLLAYAHPAGCTPEGLCFDALAKKIMKPLLNKDTLFINFSDGEPGMNNLSTETGVQVTRNIINKFRASGVNILSYFISHYNNSLSNKFIEMYGKEAELVDVKSVIDLSKTINKKFLEMGKNPLV